ncbi:virulence-associated E family protein [Salinicola corii]|nr:virulence-associated E family protein [Salinicola corii]
MADWNDLRVAQGLPAVREQLMRAVEAANDEPSYPTGSLAASNDQNPDEGRKPDVGYEPPQDHDAELDALMERLRFTDKGAIKPELSNAYEIFKHHPVWKGMLAFNEFTREVDKLRAPPFPNGEAGAWRDADAGHALVWLQQKMSMGLGHVPTADKAAMTVADEFRYHPVRQFLERLPAWDGNSRLGRLMPDVFGADETAYTEHLGKAMLVSAVARIMDSGCKVDEMIILEGGQGLGKSTCIRQLFGAEWYVELSEAPDNKDFFLTIQGAWAVEIGELQSFSKANITMVKMAITRRDDKFRPPYAVRPISHPRQCIFIGTTNATEYLIDSTGARRFLPVACRKADVGYIEQWRIQLWAEALREYRKGFRWWDVPKSEAEDEQDQRYLEDPWEERIHDYLEGHAPANAYPDWRNGGARGEPVNKVTTRELMENALRLDVGRQGMQEQRRVGNVMRHLGWMKQKQQRSALTGQRIRPYLRPGADPDAEK